MPARGDAGGDDRLSALFGYGFDRAAIGMVLVSPSGDFVRVNDEFCALVGRPAAELVGQPVSVVTHPDDQAQDEMIRRALLTHETDKFRAEKRYVRPTGEVMHARLSVRLIEDETGPLGFFGQVTDTTDLVRARHQLAETTERLRQLADATDAVWLYRVRVVPELKVEYTSRGVAALSGHPPEDFYRDPGLILASVHPDDRSMVAEALDPSTEPPDRLELRVLRPDGRTVWIDNRMSPLRNETGAVVGFEGFGYIAADRAVEEVAHASAERFRSLVQHGNDVIALVGTDGLVEWMSPTAETVLGASASAYQGRPPTDLACPDDVPGLAAALRLVEGGGAEPVEFRIRHGNGSIRWMEGLVSNLVDDPNIGAYVLTVRDVTDRRLLTDELRRRAYMDETTGLPNRPAFRQRLVSLAASRLRSRQRFAVLMVLVEGLAPIVEVFGHDWTHRLLVAAADRLLPCGGPGAAVARTSDRTLALLLPNDAGLASVTAAAVRVAAAFETPFLVDDQPFHLDAAVGVAVFPGHGTDADVLLRRAERAARAATERLSGFVVYSAALDDVTTEHISLLGHLREAIDEDHLALHYQPKVSLATGEVTGAEALVRWHHPEIGVVAPNQFVPLAERSGLIGPLTSWVVDEAVRQIASWRAEGHDLVVSVNVTPRNLQDASFPSEVTGILARWDVPPSSLCLELTERAVMTQPEAAVLACARLADAGLRLALDDFGTGQSSFAYIATLPVTELKIDGRFVRHLATSETDTAISRSIIDLGHRLGHVVTAEGVEDEAAADCLRSYGCDAAQGFHLGRPMPAADVPAWLTDRVPV